MLFFLSSNIHSPTTKFKWLSAFHKAINVIDPKMRKLNITKLHSSNSPTDSPNGAFCHYHVVSTDTTFLELSMLFQE